MTNTESEIKAREKRILDAAAEVIVRYGYDKTSMSDIAEAAGVTRAIVYLHFPGKENLFEALLFREVQKYNRDWLTAIEQDPDGGSTIGAIFRSVLYAVDQSPFISALMKQDRRIFGNYLHKPGNLFASIHTDALWVDLLQRLRQAGAIRAEIQPAVFAHIMSALAAGLLAATDAPQQGGSPSFEDTLQTVAIMIDRTLVPEGNPQSAAGKAIIHQLAREALGQFDHAEKI